MPVCGIRFWLEDWGWQIESGAGWQYNGLPIASFWQTIFFIEIHLRISGHLQLNSYWPSSKPLYVYFFQQQNSICCSFGNPIALIALMALRLLILFFRAPGRSRETNQTVLHREIFRHTSHFTEYSHNIKINLTTFKYAFFIRSWFIRQLIKNISMEYFQNKVIITSP